MFESLKQYNPHNYLRNLIFKLRYDATHFKPLNITLGLIRKNSLADVYKKRIFGPTTGKPHVNLDEVVHKIHEPTDDGSPNIFHWHWPRGTFDKRMSALEIATFILPYMPPMVGLMTTPRAKADFAMLTYRLLYWPKQALDEIVPWIRRLDYTEEDEILRLDPNATEVESGPIHFVMKCH